MIKRGEFSVTVNIDDTPDDLATAAERRLLRAFFAGVSP